MVESGQPEQGPISTYEPRPVDRPEVALREFLASLTDDVHRRLVTAYLNDPRQETIEHAIRALVEEGLPGSSGAIQD